MAVIETLSHGAVVVRAPGWDEEQPSKPSKRELLAQILAEQRKTNELLARWVNAGVSSEAKLLLAEATAHAVKTVAAAKAQSPVQPE